MADDPTVQWSLASWYGIQADADADAWYSGHANDVVVLDSGTLIVATQTGGVWSVSGSGTGLVLSESWSNPDTFCLAVGPDDPSKHLFVGCADGIIRETNLAAPLPLMTWDEIVNPLPDGAKNVRRIVILPVLRRLVAACDGGLFWASIPPTTQKSGCLFPLGKSKPRPPFVWKQAIVEGSPAQGFWDVAIGARTSSAPRSRLQDRRVITVVAGGIYKGGIFVGQWDHLDELVMRRARLFEEDGSDISFMLAASGTTSLSSCEVKPSVLYAAAAWPDGRLDTVMRSEDGGYSWRHCPSRVEGEPSPLAIVPAYAGDLGKDWANTIAVSPTNPGMVALGWQSGPFLTLDAGKTWKKPPSSPHVHPDLHRLVFTPDVPSDVHDLYVCSDGGVMRINLDDFLGGTGNPFQSNYNRQLPTLQCYSTLVRMFWGTLGASTRNPGIIATGLQDNGNVHCRVGATTTPWVDIDGGDGGWNAFMADAGMLHNTMGGPVAVSMLDPTGAITYTTIPLITKPSGPSGLNGPRADVVTRPSYKNAAGQRLTAVGASGNSVYALFTDEIGTPRYHWELIATVPAGLTIGAVGSFSGGSIFAGTESTGRMFVVDSAQGSVLELPVVLPKPSPTTQMKGGSFNRIVAFSETEIFATLNRATEESLAPSAPSPIGAITPLKPLAVSSYVLKLDALTFVPTLGAGLPAAELLYALEPVIAPGTRVPRALFTATDDRVYISRDDGATWQQASLGLPRRPHCSDLRFAADSQGGFNLYLGTYGRSVWVSRFGRAG